VAGQGTNICLFVCLFACLWYFYFFYFLCFFVYGGGVQRGLPGQSTWILLESGFWNWQAKYPILFGQSSADSCSERQVYRHPERAQPAGIHGMQM